MTIAKSVFRRCLGGRLKLANLVRKDRQSVSDHIAADFFEGGLFLSLNPPTIRIIPSVIYITGINEAVQIDTATLILAPDALWASAAMKGIIRMTPGGIYIKGVNDFVVFDTAAITMTPETIDPPHLITFWTELKIEGSLHCGPAPPLHQYYGSIFRRAVGDRLQISNLIQWNKYDNTQPLPVAAEFWEPGMGIIFSAAQLHLTGTMFIANINAQVALQGTIKMVPVLPSVAASVVMEGTIYNVPVQVVIKESVIVSPLNIDITVSRSMVDPISHATFNFDGDETGGQFSSIYYRDIIVTMPDYQSIERPVFVGFFPSSQSKYGTVDLSESFSAFDYAWYLSMQEIDDADLALLTPTGQADISQHRYMLQYDFVVRQFEIGMIVTGETTGHIGRILEIHPYGYRYIIMTIFTSGSGPFFQDDEQLLVDDVVYAAANGRTMDVTGSAGTKYPDDRVRSLLGGDNWANVTGIWPFRIANTASVWGGTKPAVDFISGATDPKLKAIDEMAEYLEFIREIKPRAFGSTYVDALYFIPQSDIDDPYSGLDLPAPIYITAPSAFLDEPVLLTQDGGTKYNRITVWCQSFTGAWLHKRIQSSGVDNGTEKLITFSQTDRNIATQTECNQRCQDLWDYNHMQILKWQAVFIERPDLQKYQKLVFSGYGLHIANGTYRIIDIQYRRADGGTTNTQTCTLIQNSQFSAYLNLNRVFTDSIKIVEALIENGINKRGVTESGTVFIDTDGKLVVTTERGIPRIARSP